MEVSNIRSIACMAASSLQCQIAFQRELLPLLLLNAVKLLLLNAVNFGYHVNTSMQQLLRLRSITWLRREAQYPIIIYAFHFLSTGNERQKRNTRDFVWKSRRGVQTNKHNVNFRSLPPILSTGSRYSFYVKVTLTRNKMNFVGTFNY